ncbi:hypothetical protein [Acidovorax sp.]|uniref:hypothetical protein n=1 Tax=Acidovorax sp. TaxID=1872122 RepID=UPI00391FAFDC
MADFITNLTGVAQVDNSLVQAYAAGIMIANGQAQILEPLVSVKEDINAVSIRFTKYGRLALATTPLLEREDVASIALSDSEILLTPKEYGNVVTTTNLSSIQTGGRVDLAAAKNVGLNMGQTQDALILQALMTAPAGNKEASAVSGAQLDGQYSKLASASVSPVGDSYVAVMPESVIAVLRAESGWVDVQKYASAEAVLKNEVGFYKGHRILRHEGVTAGHSISLGANALGKAVSQAPSMRMTSGNDKLNRFFNLGWYGVFAYGLIDPDAVQILTGV